MTKNVWFMGGLISLLCFFTACNDDDNENQTNTYAWENLRLRVNNETKQVGIVTLENKTESKAIITLLGIIPDDLSLVIEVDVTQNGETKKLQGNLKKEYFEIEIEGSLTGNLLTLDITYLNTSILVGSWNYADAYVKIESTNGIIVEAGGNPVDAAMVTAIVKNMVEPYMACLQTLTLKEEGYANVNYISLTGEAKESTHFASYYVTDNIIHFIPDAGFLLNLITKSTDTSVLSSLAIKYTPTDDGVIIFIDKQFLSVAGTILSRLTTLLENKPAIIQNYIEPILLIATQADIFELGIYLKK